MKSRKLAISLIIVSLALISLVSGTVAYYSDTEVSDNNVLAAGAVDLRIDNRSYYNDGETRISQETTWQLNDLTDQLFFNFTDLKPGDWGEDTISAHVTSNDAWLCMDINVTDTLENDQTEPESLVDETVGENEGELQNYLSFVFWADDGDNVLEDDETDNVFIREGPRLSNIGTVTLADSLDNVWTDEPNSPLIGGLDDEPVYYIGKAWCFGDLTLEPVTAGDENSPIEDPGIRCDGENVGNASQTDSVLADVVFRAVQARHNSQFRCIGCELEGDGWASSVFDANLGLQKDGDPLPAGRNDPTEALGSPDDVFVSLGYGGSLTLEMPGYITGGNVTAVEVTYGRKGYPVETADVYVSENGADFSFAGEATNKASDGENVIDISGIAMSEIRYVKLVDTTDENLHDPDSDGFDLDAIGAVVCLDGVEE